MENIKITLRDIVKNKLIIEIEKHLNNLHQLLKKNTATNDDLENIRNLESFLVELENILLGLEKEMIDETKAQEIYNKLMQLIEEHEE